MPGAMRSLKYLILQASVRTPGHLSLRLRGPNSELVLFLFFDRLTDRIQYEQEIARSRNLSE
jgi:hypothetical protein